MIAPDIGLMMNAELRDDGTTLWIEYCNSLLVPVNSITLHQKCTVLYKVDLNTFISICCHDIPDSSGCCCVLKHRKHI